MITNIFKGWLPKQTMTLGPVKYKFFFWFFIGLSSLLLMSAFLGLLVVDVTYPEEKRDDTFYLFEIFFSCVFFFIVIPILFIAKNESMTQYVLHKFYNFKFVSNIVTLIVLVKGKCLSVFTNNKVTPISETNNVI